MTLEELQELADKDLKLNDTELDLESLRTPQSKLCLCLLRDISVPSSLITVSVAT